MRPAGPGGLQDCFSKLLPVPRQGSQLPGVRLTCSLTGAGQALGSSGVHALGTLTSPSSFSPSGGACDSSHGRRGTPAGPFSESPGPACCSLNHPDHRPVWAHTCRKPLFPEVTSGLQRRRRIRASEQPSGGRRCRAQTGRDLVPSRCPGSSSPHAPAPPTRAPSAPAHWAGAGSCPRVLTPVQLSPSGVPPLSVFLEGTQIQVGVTHKKARPTPPCRIQAQV